MDSLTNLGRPATPEELGSIRPHIPPEVFDVVNEMLAKSTTVMQGTLVDAIATRLNVTRGHVFDQRWLDFEAAYEAAGWVVTYDKPGYNESYEARWEFSPS